MQEAKDGSRASELKRAVPTGLFAELKVDK
jgi:hypothetical protein